MLITGDTGFKGSWLALWLLQLGAEVYGYALPPRSDDDNFVRIKLAVDMVHRDGDIRDTEVFIDFVQNCRPDIAFHLAAQPIVLDSYEHPRETFATNVMGTVTFLEAMRMTPSVKAAVNVTSDKCYHNREWVWGYREDDPMGGRDPYSASKGCAELVTTAYTASFFSHSDACVLATARAGNVIGGGDWSPHRIVPDFFRAVRNDEPLILRYPHAVRPWQHVLEPLSGYLQLGQQLLERGNAVSGAWNFGPLTARHYSVGELVKALQQYTGKGHVETTKEAVKHHEARFLKLDISKAVNHLGWQPVLDFQTTVELTASSYLNDLQGEDARRNRLAQIEQYTAMAARAGAGWVSV